MLSTGLFRVFVFVPRLLYIYIYIYIYIYYVSFIIEPILMTQSSTCGDGGPQTFCQQMVSLMRHAEMLLRET